MASLAQTLAAIGAVQSGDFVLHSGQRSPVYLDLRLPVSFPAALRQVAQAYMQILRTLSFDLLAAYPYAALSIGTAIALETNVALLYPRKEFKAYGTGKRIEEQWQPDQRAVLFEDLITSVPTPCFPFALLAPLAVRFFFHRKDAKGAKIWGSFLFFAFFAVKS